MTLKNHNERLDAIFDIIVCSYIETAEPVGSRVLSKKHNIGLSPASIRNVMADLEEAGLLMHPHTSAGRIPTDKGYRYWVDYLMKPENLKESEKEWIVSELSKAKTVEGLADRVSKVVAEITQNAAILYFRRMKRVSFLSHLLENLIEDERLSEFLEEEDEIFIEGAFKMLEHPEFQDLVRIRQIMAALSDKEDLLEIMERDLVQHRMNIHIGLESEVENLEQMSMVFKDCVSNNTTIGGLAVLGPKRMRYPRVVSVVNFVADTISDKMSRY